jgi:hypothetical protein
VNRTWPVERQFYWIREELGAHPELPLRGPNVATRPSCPTTAPSSTNSTIWSTDARTLDPTLTSEEARRFELLATRIEEAYDAGDSITHPCPLISGHQLLPDEDYVWTKPRPEKRREVPKNSSMRWAGS